MSTFDIYTVKPGDVLEITRDGSTSRMTVSRVEPAGSSGRAYSAGPSVSAAIRPGGYATTFDAGTIAAGYIQVSIPEDPAPAPAAAPAEDPAPAEDGPTPVRIAFRYATSAGFSGDPVTAVFADYADTRDGFRTCYSHLGQHSSAGRSWVHNCTRPATPEEYAPLLSELQRIGYAVTVVQRVQWLKP